MRGLLSRIRERLQRSGTQADTPYEVAETIEMDDEDFVIAQRWEYPHYWDYSIVHKATGQCSSLRIAKVNDMQLNNPEAKRKGISNAPKEPA
jgi:hypothetical protein